MPMATFKLDIPPTIVSGRYQIYSLIRALEEGQFEVALASKVAHLGRQLSSIAQIFQFVIVTPKRYGKETNRTRRICRNIRSSSHSHQLILIGHVVNKT